MARAIALPLRSRLRSRSFDDDAIIPTCSISPKGGTRRRPSGSPWCLRNAPPSPADTAFVRRVAPGEGDRADGQALTLQIVGRWDRPALANLTIASSAKDSLNLIPSPMFHMRIDPRRSTPVQWRRPAQIPSVPSRTCRSRPRRCRHGRYRRSSGPATTGMAPSESASALAVTTPQWWWCTRGFRRCSRSGSPAPTPV
jgi:hypothetical protein